MELIARDLTMKILRYLTNFHIAKVLITTPLKNVVIKFNVI